MSFIVVYGTHFLDMKEKALDVGGNIVTMQQLPWLLSRYANYDLWWTNLYCISPRLTRALFLVYLLFIFFFSSILCNVCCGTDKEKQQHACAVRENTVELDVIPRAAARCGGPEVGRKKFARLLS